MIVYVYHMKEALLGVCVCKCEGVTAWCVCAALEGGSAEFGILLHSRRRFLVYVQHVNEAVLSSCMFV